MEAISHQGVFYYRLEVSSMGAVHHQGVFYYRSEISSMEARPRKNRVVFQLPCQKKIRVGQHFFVVFFLLCIPVAYSEILRPLPMIGKIISKNTKPARNCCLK